MKSANTSIRTLVLVAALAFSGAALLGVAQIASAQEKADPKALKIGEKVGKPLSAALDAVQKKQFDVALAKIKEADAVEKKKPFEQFKIDETTAYLYASQQKDGEVAAVYEKMLQTPQFLDPKQYGGLVKQIAVSYFRAQQYDKSAEYSKLWLKDNPTDLDVVGLLGQTYYTQKDYKQAREQMMAATAAAEKSGQAPKEGWLQFWRASSIELGDDAGITTVYEKLVRYYPKADTWDRLLGRVSANERSDRVMFQWFRLMADVGALKRSDQYMEYTQLALDAAMPGEALKAVETGYEQKILGVEAKDKERHQRLLNKAKESVQADKAQLPQVEKEAQAAAATGGMVAGLGLAYFSYDQYDKAVESLENGIKKGGLKNPEEYKIALGISQMKRGNKDQARDTFKSVAVDSPLAKVASMWVLRTYN